ncbi:MAG: KpsF/GutQ family sugar-phosphate isomerase [Kiritimatiellae bacterium]|nr:KpsF/GutQ family sugar-phosphate isomerase [Kiritimatiellia bacterium]
MRTAEPQNIEPRNDEGKPTCRFRLDRGEHMLDFMGMRDKRTNALTKADCLRHARQVIDVEIEALRRTRDALGQAFVATVELMLAAIERHGKIVVTGVGKNLPIAEKISATLASTGSTSVVLNPVQALHGDLGILAAGDVLLALSFSGESDELLALMPAVRRLDVPIVGLTGRPDSSLAACCQVVLPVAIEREACPFNMAPTASTTATLAVGDALAMVLLDARGFQRDDYARLHPAGAIGRALLTRVSDIMRTGERIATVGSAASVQDALVAMTRAQAGMACILNADGTLAGIFTDGDLRRQLTRSANSLSMPIREVMTAKPISACASQLAVDVLRLFEDHHIDDLPVVDENGLLVGCVDIQDLPRLKIL